MKNTTYSHNVKKHQRLMNKFMRGMNKSLEKDNLWRGRFFVRQVDRYFEKFEDGSGGQLHVTLMFCDKKTKKTKKIRESVNRLCGFGHLFWEMNSFIVEYLDVWHTEGIESFKSDTTDYINMKWED